MRTLGFADVVEVAIGADLCTVEEAHDFLEEVPEKLDWMGTSCCPAWSMMAKKLFPQFKDNISMALTPMVITARMVKKDHPNARIVFVGPCSAKKLEANRRSVRSDVDFVLTFEELLGMFDAKEIDFATIEADSADGMNEGSGMGRGFAVGGGVAAAVVEAIRHIDPDREVLIEYGDGLKECRKMLAMAKAGKRNGYLLEGMGCPGGCVAGAGTISQVKDSMMNVERFKNDAAAFSTTESPYLGPAERSRRKMLSLILLRQIAQLFILVFLGWAIVKAGILKSEDSRTLSMILLYIITPCVALNAFQLERTADTVRMMELSLLSAVILSGLCVILGGLVSKPFHLDVVEAASVMYPNCTNMVLPIVIGTFGEDWVMYVTCYSIVQTVLIWTHARIFISGRHELSVRNLLCNVNILAILAGMLLFAFQIRLPGIVKGAFAQAGNTVGPVAMLIVGMLLADITPEVLRGYRQIWKPVLLRLVVLPVILVTIMKYSGLAALAPHGETLILISLLSAIAPSANAVTQFSQIFGRDARYSGLINIVTMLLCIVTIPLLAAYYQM